MIYTCAKCPAYKKYGKIYWEPKKKQRLCETHIEEAWKEEKKK